MGGCKHGKTSIIITDLIIVGSSVIANRSGLENSWGQAACGKYNTHISGFMTI